MAEDFSDRVRPFTYLAGIVSFGRSECGTGGFPGVYVVIFIVRSCSFNLEYQVSF